ncbi:protein O-mannose kinase-like [Procambarus clarkii]|uniref:protein O-mannose kinase-like n=1 Tax=Procambarus clarkii TaxID=6728 RepID=UPI00374476B5
MCDSSTLNKTLEQYLISSSLNLILNDVDALPEVGHEGIICGHKELQGSFVAPEQRWPYSMQVYDEKKMVPYDEKVDIWKIPAVCNYYLGKSEGAKAFRYHVYPIHKQCREKLPRNRPSASEVLQFYESLLREYFRAELTNVKEEL